MNDVQAINYASAPRTPWVRRILLASIPIIGCCILSAVMSYVCMKVAQKAEGQIILDNSKHVALYHNLIEDVPGILVSVGAILSAILLIAMAILKKIPPAFGFFAFAYPVVWYGEIFFIVLNSFEAFN